MQATLAAAALPLQSRVCRTCWWWDALAPEYQSYCLPTRQVWSVVIFSPCLIYMIEFRSDHWMEPEDQQTNHKTVIVFHALDRKAQMSISSSPRHSSVLSCTPIQRTERLSIELIYTSSQTQALYFLSQLAVDCKDSSGLHTFQPLPPSELLFLSHVLKKCKSEERPCCCDASSINSR